MQICSCPYGFEDGRILGYRALSDRLELSYEFWNGKRGTLVFDGFLGARDLGAIEMDVGSFSQQNDSEFIALLVERNYEKRPDDLDWKHFRFLDVEDSAIFEVVAPSRSFVEAADSNDRQIGQADRPGTIASGD
jgi:hypothetical protein